MQQTWRANKAMPASARLPVGLTSTKHRRIAVQSCCGWKKPIFSTRLALYYHVKLPLVSITYDARKASHHLEKTTLYLADPLGATLRYLIARERPN